MKINCVYSQLQITRTLPTRTARKLERKSVSPWFPPYIYCNFPLDNSNLPLIRSIFLGHFYIVLEPCFKRVASRRKNCTAVRNIAFISKRSCILCIPSGKKYISRWKWSMRDTCISPPSHFLNSGYCFELPMTRFLFHSLRRFKLSGFLKCWTKARVP